MPSAIRVIDDITELGASGFNADEYAKWNGSVFVGDTPAGGGSPGGNDKQIQFNNAAAFGGAAGFEYQSGASPNVSLQAQNAAYVPLLVKAAASQSVNILEIQNSAGTVVNSSSYGGRIFIQPTDISNDQVVIRYGLGMSSAHDIMRIENSAGSAVLWSINRGGTVNIVAGATIYGQDGVGNHLIVNSSGFLAKSGATEIGNLGRLSDRGGGSAIGLWGRSGRPFQIGDGSGYGIEIRDAVITESAAAVPLTVKGAASQSANMQDWTNSSDTVMLSVQADGDLQFDDGVDIVLDTTTGTMLGTATAQKLGFWGATPVVQQVLATGGGATVDNVISLLQTLGLCKQS